jgi:hypothetical protein
MKSFIARPGAVQMLVSGSILILTGLWPIFMAISHRQSFVLLTGTPAVAATLAAAILGCAYFVGFLRYCSSKGYSQWIGLCLFLGHFAGFLALLLLPDLNTPGHSNPARRPMSRSVTEQWR